MIYLKLSLLFLLTIAAHLYLPGCSTSYSKSKSLGANTVTTTCNIHILQDDDLGPIP